MAELWCPRCDSHVVTEWRIIGNTQWYTCARGHKFSNPIIIPDAAGAAGATSAHEPAESITLPEGN